MLGPFQKSKRQLIQAWGMMVPNLTPFNVKIPSL